MWIQIRVIHCFIVLQTAMLCYTANTTSLATNVHADFFELLLCGLVCKGYYHVYSSSFSYSLVLKHDRETVSQYLLQQTTV